MSDFATATIEWGTTDTITLLELLKQQLGITDNSRDVELSMYLQMAGEACERYIDNKIDAQAVTESYARAMTPVALRYYPATAPITVTVAGDDVSDEWSVYLRDGILWATKSDCHPDYNCCFEQLTFAYEAGYDPLPSDLGYAVVRAAGAYESGQGGLSGAIKKEVVQGVGSIEYATDSDSPGNVGMLSTAVTGTLDMYRRLYS